jgi:GNAT superfamily N-acetyltransferase
VVTSRGDVHYVVTEYGVADLWGKSVRERSLALIEIAHPDHRSELLAQAKLRKYVFQDQRESLVAQQIRPETLTLPDGAAVHIRALRATDERVLQDLFYRLSDDSTYQRFLCHKRRHSREEIARFTDFSDARNAALVVTSNEESEELLAVARYDCDPATGYADVAFVVRDEWQGRGIGTALFARLARLAKEQGLAGFTADVLVNNGHMLAIFKGGGFPVHRRLEDGICHLEIPFQAGVEQARA